MQKYKYNKKYVIKYIIKMDYTFSWEGDCERTEKVEKKNITK